jgi:pimeloyl-ACP methyl ester carboxylesterase
MGVPGCGEKEPILYVVPNLAADFPLLSSATRRWRILQHRWSSAGLPGLTFPMLAIYLIKADNPIAIRHQIGANMRIAALCSVAAAALFALSAACAGELPPGALEKSVCGSFKEWAAFALWTSAAGSPSPNAAKAVKNVSATEHTTQDGRILRGYRIKADGSSKGAVLFAQGNAMLADALLQPLAVLARDGFDVYVYDFRGYGNSQGTPRLQAIISDYTELATALVANKPNALFFYGVSFGGVILTNVAHKGVTPTAMVVDSSPSQVSDLGCPESYNPVANIPARAEHILVIIGDKDRVVPPARSAALGARVLAAGGKVARREEFAHPFMDTDKSIALERFNLASEFFQNAARITNDK